LDQHGRPASLTDWNNKIVIANVFFTHCPVICPKMTKNLSKVQQVFHGRNVLLSSFSIDPERDSISQLKNYAQKMQVTGNWQLLTGDKKVIYTFARKSLLVPAAEGDGGADDFIHSERLVLMDRNKKIRGFYKGTDELETVRLINDIKKLLNE
jgi:protein SCO1/2